MSYEKQTWNTGDVVTASKLNHIEEGVANANSSSTKNSQWQGLTIDFMGDSITAGSQLSSGQKIYWQWLAQMLNATKTNGYGLSGSTISSHVNGMYNRVLSMDKNADLIFVLGGTNDYGCRNDQVTEIGEQFVMDGTTRTLNVDVSTFWGAVNQMCLNLMTTFPKATYILLTPIHRSHLYGYNGDFLANTKGYYLDDYVEVIKKAGAWFSIPVIDLYATSSLYPEFYTTRSSTYYADGVHPNALGHKAMAQTIYEALDKIARKPTSV